MNTDFDITVNRENTGSCKWEAVPSHLRGKGYIPMSVADMEMPVAKPIKDALVKAAQHGICGYTEPDKMYMDALSGFMKRRHGLDVKRENLVCTMGIVPAFGIIIRALTRENDGIILQPPVYTPFFDAISGNGRRIVENPLVRCGDTYEINFSELETLCADENNKMLMLCSPHNPAGRVWTYDELCRIGEICKKHDVIILCDEIHNDIIRRDVKHISLATIQKYRDMTITCTAMSKTFNLAGLMLSNIFIFNEDLYKKINKQVGTDGSYCIPYFGRCAAISAFTECDTWIDDLCSYIDDNFNFCYDFFRDNLPMLKPLHSQGTYLLWLDCSALGMKNDELVKFLADEAGCIVNGGKGFGTGGDGFIRVNIALPRDELEKALIRMKNAIGEIK